MGVKAMTIRELVEQFRETATVRTVYGDPIEKDGITVIPAARVLGGGGGGEGEGPQGQGKGTGGGFGLMARPVGAYVVKDGRVTWKPAVDLGQVLLFAIVAVFGMRSAVRACARCCAARASASPSGCGERSGCQCCARSRSSA
jgi:uncharacterized spore protein YtfJ